MVRLRKNNSIILEKASLRAAGLQAIGKDLDFGQGLSLRAYNQLILEVRTKMASYNAALTNIDQTKTEIATLERTLADISDRMLTGVATQYGKNSPEYSIAGGVPKSERRRRKAPAAAPEA
jgi:hypothetical protein